MELILLLIAVYIISWLISWIVITIRNSAKYSALDPKLQKIDSLERYMAEFELKIKKDEEDWNEKIQKGRIDLQKLNNLERSILEHKLKVEKDRKEWDEKLQSDKSELQKNAEQHKLNIEKYREELNEKVQNDKAELRKIAKQKSMGFPWLAEAYADYFALKDGEIEGHLRNKNHPAHAAAESVRIIKQEKRELLKENKIVSYKIAYLEKLFPWLSDLIADDEDEEIPVFIGSADEIDDGEDACRKYLTPEEYKNLPSVQRNQMALDRYLQNRNKSKWAIGRDYEMYVGYLYERKGYDIEYKGIIDGFEDLGRPQFNEEVQHLEKKAYSWYSGWIWKNNTGTSV